MNPVAIVGAGISGLTAGFYLQQRGIPVTIFEASDHAGGMIRTSSNDGYLVEYGPNTIMTNSVAIPTLIRDLDLQSRRLIPSAAAEKRYIVRNGKPVALPNSPASAVNTPLLSFGNKLRVLGEPFIGKSSVDDESLAAFVVRRLGREFLDFLIDPFVAGVFAGDPSQLSVRHAFPKMAALEDNYGSLIKGAFLGAKERKLRNAPLKSEPKMFSFDAGLQVLPDTLATRLDRAIRLNCPVESIERYPDGWAVDSRAGRETFASVLFCSPAHQLLPIDSGFGQVYYPPIARIAFGFRKSQIAHPLDGFGALVPRVERMSILGALFSSSMFDNRAPEDHVLLTVFAGGARNPRLPRLASGQIAKLALADLRRMLGITGTPWFVDTAVVERSIPQYNVGYAAVKDLVRAVEARCPGVLLAGSYSHGISVSDCIAGGAAAAEKVAAYAGSRSLAYA